MGERTDRVIEGADRRKLMAWVGREVLPHEADVRAWLNRTLAPDDVEDVLQEVYCRISELDSVAHIRSGRAYLFQASRNLVLDKLRRSRVISIEAVAEIDTAFVVRDELSPERVAAGRRELARVQRLIAALPDRCRRIFELRRIDELSQREVAERMKLPEYTIDYELRRGLKLIQQRLAAGEAAAEQAINRIENDARSQDTRGD